MARSLKDAILETPLVYRLWQAPWVRAKLQPVFAHNDMREVGRVLDLGCGPGTNAPCFGHCDYLGIDINASYIETARRRHAREFMVADMREFSGPGTERFDFILLNSFLHHIDDEDALVILESARALLSDDGHVHILDLVLPGSPSVARHLARHDRGKFPRPLERWNEMFTSIFEPVVVEPFPLRGLGVTLWNMLYFKGRART